MEAHDIFEVPFSTDGLYIYTANGNMALMAVGLDDNCDAIMKRTCQILNGEVYPQKGAELTYKDSEIYLNGKLFLVVRGWGTLTGTGGYNLSQTEAARLQDQFGEWVVKMLKGNDSPL